MSEPWCFSQQVSWAVGLTSESHLAACTDLGGAWEGLSSIKVSVCFISVSLTSMADYALLSGAASSQVSNTCACCDLQCIGKVFLKQHKEVKMPFEEQCC